MRFVDRKGIAAPDSLSHAEGKGKSELAKARESFEQAQSAGTLKDWSYKFAAYSGDDVKLALEKLFHGKCAYCETRYAAQAPVDVEHYRPKGAVAGDDAVNHPGYWWVAMAWDNLLPSCIDCNRRRWHDLPDLPESLQELHVGLELRKGQGKLGKEDYFPIAGTRVDVEGGDLASEQALLLEPTIDDPMRHLTYHLDEDEPLALVVPKMIDGKLSARGIASIHVYGLNRLALVQERTRVLKQLIFLAEMVQDLDDIEAELRSTDTRMAQRISALSERVMMEIGRMAQHDQPYCTLVREWLGKSSS